jgi:hypothetical protein
MNERKTPGQLAYERDLARKPLYHDGSARPTWADLWAAAKDSWERNPNDRDD